MFTKAPLLPFAAGLLTITLGAGLPAHAESPANYRITVPVVAAVPIVERRVASRPERHCEPVSRGRGDYAGRDFYRAPERRVYSTHEPARRGGVGAQIIGGLIGGVIGNQFGGGNGRKALTVAGALVGSSIARDNVRGRTERYSYRDQSFRDGRNGRNGGYRRSGYGAHEPDYVCRTTHSERVVEAVVGYDVTYSYNNSLHSRRMDYDPGDQLELTVRAVPEEISAR